MPVIDRDHSGANFYDRDDDTLWLVVKGSYPVDIRTAPLLIISFEFPSMTVEEFYGSNIVNNLAIFLNIPPEKIKASKTSKRFHFCKK